MQALNPDITIETYHRYVSAETIGDIIHGFDFIIDGTDNFATKFLINDACVMAGIPFSHGGILRFTGQTMTVVPGRSACYRCVFNAPPPKDSVPTCAQAGVLGAIPGMLGSIQAAEALKCICAVGSPLTDSLLTFDATTMDFRKIRLQKRTSCPVCGDTPSITRLHDEQHVVCELKNEDG
jgi:molybdopterin/thiamine biosynthesis adenylyltransferase